MQKYILSNAFSLNMLADLGDNGLNILVREIPARWARRWMRNSGFHSIVGHADTATVLGAELGLEVPCNRESVTLQAGARLIVGQYSGPRLPEGATQLPEGASIRWLLVEIG